jgi:hypothetical protein
LTKESPPAAAILISILKSGSGTGLEDPKGYVRKCRKLRNVRNKKGLLLRGKALVCLVPKAGLEPAQAYAH